MRPAQNRDGGEAVETRGDLTPRPSRPRERLTLADQPPRAIAEVAGDGKALHRQEHQHQRDDTEWPPGDGRIVCTEQDGEQHAEKDGGQHDDVSDPRLIGFTQQPEIDDDGERRE